MPSPRLIWQWESNPRLPAEAPACAVGTAGRSAQAGPFSVWGKYGKNISRGGTRMRRRLIGYGGTWYVT
jgi:hypothetical protein